MLSVGGFSSSISVKWMHKYSGGSSRARQERAFGVGHRGGVQVRHIGFRASTTVISRAIALPDSDTLIMLVAQKSYSG